MVAVDRGGGGDWREDRDDHGMIFEEKGDFMGVNYLPQNMGSISIPFPFPSLFSWPYTEFQMLINHNQSSLLLLLPFFSSILRGRERERRVLSSRRAHLLYVVYMDWIVD